MRLNDMKAVAGARRRSVRVGRGVGSGFGKTCGAGQKGQSSRSGGLKAPGFEGGQLPLYRRLPKFGFKNVNRITYATVNLASLNRFADGTKVFPALLVEEGLVKKELSGIKILAGGKLERKLIVQAHRFSKAAKQAIEEAGGTAEVIVR